MLLSMPTYHSTVLGPEPRDPDQPFWDPEVQTMPREQLRARTGYKQVRLVDE
jgi:hypothetical protein